MFLRCKVCGFGVEWEDLKLGHLERNVYRCTNNKCVKHKDFYIIDSTRLPQWVQHTMGYKKVG